MAEKSITIASLNLWNFYEWEKRLPAILSLLGSLGPDVVVLQEVQQDGSRDLRNQAEILNEKLAYPYIHFERACVKTSRKGRPLTNPVDHGLAILSKYPITLETIKLTQAVDDKESRIILKADIDVNGTLVPLAGVHFSNSDAWADAHFREAIHILGKEKNRPIIMGDFNIKNLKRYKSLYEGDYVSSSDSFEYVSYPQDNLSYDYLLIPKNYSFIDFQCRPENVSDHRLLLAEIKIK